MIRSSRMISAFDPAIPIDQMKQKTRMIEGKHLLIASNEDETASLDDPVSDDDGNPEDMGETNNGAENDVKVDADHPLNGGPAVYNDDEIWRRRKERKSDVTDDTEDEEVKMNCIGGVKGLRDSDMSDDSENDSVDESISEGENNDSDDENDDERDGKVHLVNFVGKQIGPSDSGVQIQKPTPVMGHAQQQQHVTFVTTDLKGIERNGEDSSDDDTSSTDSSVSGARGIGLSFGTSSRASVSGEDDNESENDEDEDMVQSDASLSSAVASDEEDDDNEDDREEEDEEYGDGEEEEEEENDDSKEYSSPAVGEDNTEDTDEPTFRRSKKNELEYSDEDREANDSAKDRDGSWDVRPSGQGDPSQAPPLSPSLSMGDLEEMLEVEYADKVESEESANSSSSEEEESPMNRYTQGSSPENELEDLFADALEFDYWSPETLEAVASSLYSSTASSYPIRLPRRDDEHFWIDKMALLSIPEPRLKDYFVNNQDDRLLASRIMFDAFHTATTSLDVTEIPLRQENSFVSQTSPKLYVGSFSAAEARLALSILRIKRIIQISYHPLDELWTKDNIKYATHILPSLGDGGAGPVYNAIAEAAQEVANAVNEEAGNGRDGTSVLVACSTGDEHSCAVCAMYLSQRLEIPIETAAERIAKLRPSCRIDPEWLHSDSSPRNPKRVLSSNYLLSGLSGGVGPDLGFDSPKRKRCAKEEQPASMPLLPSLSLGPTATADQQSTTLTRGCLKMRGSVEDYVSSSTDDEIENDKRLSEELEEKEGSEKGREESSTPVPLLTPPASPVQIQSKDGGTTTICEWPSNLTVDSAMTSAITTVRPLSPESLQRQEEEEDQRTGISPHQSTSTEKGGQIMNDKSQLTPLIRGMCVKFH